MKSLRIGLTMRVCQVGPESRDSLARDWWTLKSQVDPESIWLPVPNLGAKCARWAEELELDALILTGGEDLGSDPARDQSEESLLGWARQHRRAVLGVCRGHQLLCSQGGQLLRLEDQSHRARLHAIDWSDDLVGVAECGQIWQVNSYHNWQVRTAPEDYRVLASSPDGGIEAVAHRTLPWLAVQWHPERPNPEISQQVLLFQHFLHRVRIGT